jgi:P27 family predicted phage terminase small subunit
MPRGGRREGAGRKPKQAPEGPKIAPSPLRPAAPVLAVIEGGAGSSEIAEPDWTQFYADDLDLRVARSQWQAIVSELRGTEKLAAANLHQVKRYVMWCVQYEVAARHVAEEGAVFPRRGKKQPAWNPWFSVMKDASSRCEAIEAELTLSPRRRNNGGKVPRKVRRVGASEEFI